MTPVTVHPSACWIWPDNHCWDLHNGYAQFRRRFELDTIPDHAPAWITADQSYRLWVNGRPVCRGPARGFQDHWPCDQADLAPFLKTGSNVIAVRAYNPGHGTFGYVSATSAGILFSAQWGDFLLVSDASWRMRRQTGVRKDTVPTSVQLVHQEHLDARLEPSDWTAPGFDDTGWQCDFPDQRKVGCMPWRTLEPRGIPLLEERDVTPVRLLGIGEGPAASGASGSRDVVESRIHENRGHKPSGGSPTTGAACARQVLPPTGTGRFRSLLFDFGHTVVGCPRLHVLGAQGGETCDVLVYETIDTATLEPHIDRPNPSRIAMGHRLVCAAGETCHEFHLPFGFRYLELVVRESAAPLDLTVVLRWIGYPIPHQGSFESSDPVLDKIWRACAWTQQCCSLDAYVDTPWREQSQWWGDARVQAWNTFYLNGDTRLFRRGITQIAEQTSPDGLTYGHAPTVAHGCILPDFTLIWILTLWDYYWQTGSIEPFQTHRKTAENALVYFESRLHPDFGLLAYDEHHWLFLDWTGLFKEGYPALYSLWFLCALQKLRALDTLSASPDPTFADRVRSLETRVTLGLKKLIGNDGLLRDGLSLDGTPVIETSIHTQTLAITAGLDPANDRARLDRMIRPYVRGEYAPVIQPSAYWITYVFTELISHGHGGEVIDCIRRRWEPMARHGTTWETFAPKPGSESHSHAWSAHPLYHLMQTVGGITQTAPAWRHIIFRPAFYGKKGGATVPTPHGPVSAGWQRTDERIQVTLTLPAKVTAHVLLPRERACNLTGPLVWTKSVRHPEQTPASTAAGRASPCDIALSDS
ncbi:MAG TPA: alpha-L-rhamnosidase C-terminal domain-containing protein [Rariglobus sp.]